MCLNWDNLNKNGPINTKFKTIWWLFVYLIRINAETKFEKRQPTKNEMHEWNEISKYALNEHLIIVHFGVEYFFYSRKPLTTEKKNTWSGAALSLMKIGNCVFFSVKVNVVLDFFYKMIKPSFSCGLDSSRFKRFTFPKAKKINWGG